jgi:hypothetical protein
MRYALPAALALWAVIALACHAMAAEPDRTQAEAAAEYAYTLGECWHADPEPNTDQRAKAQLPEPLYALYERGKADERAKPIHLTYAQCRALIDRAVDRLPKSPQG